jgi:hypothetical protein
VFNEPVNFSEADYRAIRAVGHTDGGKLLAQFIQQEAEAHVRGMLNSPAEDTASMAHGQAGAEFGKKILLLLQADIQVILDQHNVEVQDE